MADSRPTKIPCVTMHSSLVAWHTDGRQLYTKSLASCMMEPCTALTFVAGQAQQIFFFLGASALPVPAGELLISLREDAQPFLLRAVVHAILLVIVRAAMAETGRTYYVRGVIVKPPEPRAEVLRAACARISHGDPCSCACENSTVHISFTLASSVQHFG